jgi:hypothetical protein
MDNPDDFEQFESIDVPDDPTAVEIADLLAEQFHDPTVTRVVAAFEEQVVEFDASDIGNIEAIDGVVHGMIRETPDVSTIEQVSVRRKPWLTERLDELAEASVGDTLRLNYESRFGGDVTKDIHVSRTLVETDAEPHGYAGWEPPEGADVEDEPNLDVAAVVGHLEDAEFNVLVQTNGGVQLLMNETRIVEPGTIPQFEVVTNDDSE